MSPMEGHGKINEIRSKFGDARHTILPKLVANDPGTTECAEVIDEEETNANPSYGTLVHYTCEPPCTLGNLGGLGKSHATPVDRLVNRDVSETT